MGGIRKVKAAYYVCNIVIEEEEKIVLDMKYILLSYSNINFTNKMIVFHETFFPPFKFLESLSDIHQTYL